MGSEPGVFWAAGDVPASRSTKGAEPEPAPGPGPKPAKARAERGDQVRIPHRRLGGGVKTVALADAEHVTVRPDKRYKMSGALVGLPLDAAITRVLLLTVNVSGSDRGS